MQRAARFRQDGGTSGLAQDEVSTKEKKQTQRRDKEEQEKMSGKTIKKKKPVKRGNLRKNKDPLDQDGRQGRNKRLLKMWV